MADVVEFGGITKLDIPPERILNGALESNLQSAVVIGFDEDGEFYFASSQADGGEVLWLLELARIGLMRSAEEMME